MLAVLIGITKKNGKLNLATTPRSVGSSFKPIVYAAALDTRLITPATLLKDNPTTFTPVTATGTLTTGGSTFSNNAVSVTFPAAVNNQSQKVWARIIANSATTGSSNRASTGVDDVKFTWN